MVSPVTFQDRAGLFTAVVRVDRHQDPSVLELAVVVFGLFFGHPPTHGDERQKGGQCEGRMSVEKGATVEEGSEPRGLVMSTSLLGGSKDVDGGAVRIDSAKGAG